MLHDKPFGHYCRMALSQAPLKSVQMQTLTRFAATRPKIKVGNPPTGTFATNWGLQTHPDTCSVWAETSYNSLIIPRSQQKHNEPSAFPAPCLSEYNERTAPPLPSCKSLSVKVSDQRLDGCVEPDLSSRCGGSVRLNDRQVLGPMAPLS